MILKCDCPYCKKSSFASVTVGFEEQIFESETELKTYVLESATVVKIDTAEELIEMIKPHVKKGRSLSENIRILKRVFGLSDKSCRALLPKIKGIGVFSLSLLLAYTVPTLAQIY